MANRNINLSVLYTSILFFLFDFRYSSSQKTCPNCFSKQVPYPLSTNPSCGNKDYAIRCDPISHNLFFDALNNSSYRILNIKPLSRKIILETSPWLPNTCVTKQALREGIRLNQTLPFNITSSNTIFLFSCSPRLLISPLNCTPSSLCHVYLESSGHIEKTRAQKCTSGQQPCCTFVAGGMPSAYKIRLHSSGCRAFRSILHLDPQKPAREWEERLEIQWAPPSKSVCDKGYVWNFTIGVCSKRKKSNTFLLLIVLCGVVLFSILVVIFSVINVIRSGKYYQKAKLVKIAKTREDILRSNNSGKSAKMLSLPVLKKATNGFSKDRILGSGGFGEVYKGKLEDGTIMAVKSAKIGDVKSTQQVLNEVSILSQVNHKNLVRLIGCCVESQQPLMVYEYVSNGSLYEHIHNLFTFLDLKTSVKIALQTAEALAYLHSMAYAPIYHRDVKSMNILLDDGFNAKVADFGLSRLAKPGLSHVSTCAQGTLGYLDPEYYKNYQVTDKSDVYSFGVVLLELCTSQKAIDFSREQDDVNLVTYVTERSNNGTIMEIFDKRLMENTVKVTMGLRLLGFCVSLRVALYNGNGLPREGC